MFDLRKFQKIFMSKRNNQFNFIVKPDSLDGHIIMLEEENKISIMIRLDNTLRIPKAI